MTNAYFGEQYSNETIKRFLKNLKDASWRKLNNDELIDHISAQISKGRVIGWIEGRFEWGPGALGNRSILADPRNPKMKGIINAKVKFREAFRPFAPFVLADKASKVFDFSDIQLTTNN